MQTIVQAAPHSAAVSRSRVRYRILGMLFFVTVVNYADRATISIAGSAMSADLGLDSVGMGFIFSAFGWAYVLAQLPGGWLLDRFGSKAVYFFSLFFWSLFTVLQGGVQLLGPAVAVYALFLLRFLVGAAEAPSFPANSRIVAAWFPTTERGTAASIFNSASYFATVLFAPLMGWLTVHWGWHFVFVVMGIVGLLTSAVWLKVIHSPKDHPAINAGELAYLRDGGALIDIDAAGAKAGSTTVRRKSSLADIKSLLTNRMLVGIYLSQYCVTALTYFFLTWFPIYLVQQRGMSILTAGVVASIPAICGFGGNILGGAFSDWLIRRGHSLSVARKTPIVIGMMLSTSMVVCNYIDAHWLVVAFMALSFFGKGLGALGWAVVADTSPKNIIGVSGGMFNMFGNIAAITTPIAIGYIVHNTGSFNGALVFVAAHAVVAIFSYLFIVGKIKRVEMA